MFGACSTHIKHDSHLFQWPSTSKTPYVLIIQPTVFEPAFKFEKKKHKRLRRFSWIVYTRFWKFRKSCVMEFQLFFLLQVRRFSDPGQQQLTSFLVSLQDFLECLSCENLEHEDFLKEMFRIKWIQSWMGISTAPFAQANLQCGVRINTAGKFNPFTPKSDQCQISPAASPEILYITVRRTWLFIAYSDERWLYYYQFSLPHLYISRQEVGRIYFLNLVVKWSCEHKSNFNQYPWARAGGQMLSALAFGQPALHRVSPACSYFELSPEFSQ